MKKIILIIMSKKKTNSNHLIKKEKKKKIKKIDILNQNIGFILNKPNKLISNYDKVEQACMQLKDPKYNLLSQSELNDENDIIKQNSKILKYFIQLGKIVSILSDNIKIPLIKKNQIIIYIIITII